MWLLEIKWSSGKMMVKSSKWWSSEGLSFVKLTMAWLFDPIVRWLLDDIRMGMNVCMMCRNFRFGVNTGNSYRSEMRQPSGVVKGVYSWLKPDGSPQTIAYASDANGYRAIPVNQMGLQLPAFPYSLYHPGQAHPRTQQKDKVDGDMVVIEGSPSGEILLFSSKIVKPIMSEEVGSTFGLID